VAIVGAGPYGLSLAAQLGNRGISYRIFGPPMNFWRGLPKGVHLKSPDFGTSLYVPRAGYSFPEWCRKRGIAASDPIPMQSFAAYGLWVQEQFVPDVCPEQVVNVTQHGGDGFSITLESGRQSLARRVVIATGLSHVARVPAAFADLPNELLFHTHFLPDYARFKGKEVAVIGGGSSAVEAGALVHEAGGAAQILVRKDRVVFHSQTPQTRPLLERIRNPMTVLGAGRKHWVLQHIPLAVYFVPEAKRIRFVRGHLGPDAPWWIKDRVVGKVPIHTRNDVIAARAVGDRVHLTLRTDEGERQLAVDHVIAGTGYEMTLDRLPFLDGALRERLARVAHSPALSINFESSVKGLYFIGPMSAMSFGPLVRFVAGADFTVRRLASHLGGPLAKAQATARAWQRRMSGRALTQVE